LRKRRIGAGRKPSPDALDLLAYARAKYGEQTLKVLRAAWRLARAQAMELQSRPKLDGTTKLRLIVVPQLVGTENNCGSTIISGGNAQASAGGGANNVTRNGQGNGHSLIQRVL
jgi:hypothetical protein